MLEFVVDRFWSDFKRSVGTYILIFRFCSRHNDLPYNLYNRLQNKLTDFHFDEDLTNDPIFGQEVCSSCFTDLPRLRKGKVGAQVFNDYLYSNFKIICCILQFWVAYVSCQIQYKDALAKTIEQIDVIRRLVKKYPSDLQLVTTADGEQLIAFVMTIYRKINIICT